MKRMEDDLRKTLSRTDPSPDFTDKVMERIDALNSIQGSALPEETKPRKLLFNLPKWVFAAAFASLLVLIGVFFYNQREQHRVAAEVAAGEEAKEQLMMAMRITSNKLNKTRNKLLDKSQR